MRRERTWNLTPLTTITKQRILERIKAGGEQAADDQAVTWIIEHYAGGNAR